jgi:hypothetical protein
VCAQLDRLRGYPYRARQVAMNAAKHQLRAQGLKLTQTSYREIVAVTGGILRPRSRSVEARRRVPRSAA